MLLFFLQCHQHALSKLSGGIGELEQHQSHQLGCQQFMVGKEVQQLPTRFFIFQLMIAWWLLVATGLVHHQQVRGPAGSSQ